MESERQRGASFSVHSSREAAINPQLRTRYHRRLPVRLTDFFPRTHPSRSITRSLRPPGILIISDTFQLTRGNSPISPTKSHRFTRVRRRALACLSISNGDCETQRVLQASWKRRRVRRRDERAHFPSRARTKRERERERKTSITS